MCINMADMLATKMQKQVLHNNNLTFSGSINSYIQTYIAYRLRKMEAMR